MASSVDLNFLPEKIVLSKETLAEADHRKRGISFEHDWQSQLGIYMVPVLGSPADGRSMVSQQNVDAKLLLGEYLWLSHHEYCYGRKNGMIYAGYVEDGPIARLALAVTWQDLREHGLFQRAENKRPSNGEAPWSISLLAAMKLNLL